MPTQVEQEAQPDPSDIVLTMGKALGSQNLGRTFDIIERVRAEIFYHFMSSGRTSPALCSCIALEDTGAIRDVVVKLRGGMESSMGSLCELYGALLASHFSLDTPSPCLVLITDEFAEVASYELQEEKARMIRESVGWNYGSEALKAFSIWPVNRRVTPQQEATAMDVFAFDALVQNVDRRRENPNLGTQGDQIVIFDHECAFSFLLAILPSPRPWELVNEVYLANHVFRSSLNGLQYDGSFREKLSSLSDDVIAGFVENVPDEWPRDYIPRIEQHLRLMRDNAEVFINNLQRSLQ